MKTTPQPAAYHCDTDGGPDGYTLCPACYWYGVMDFEREFWRPRSWGVHPIEFACDGCTRPIEPAREETS